MIRERFHGQIGGTGSTSGVRVVIGHWPQSPFGSFTDAMVADSAGHRVLIAPTPEIAEYVSQTYQFDEVEVVGVRFDDSDNAWSFEGGPLSVRLGTGRRTLLGALLRPIPRAVSAAPVSTVLTDPIARIVLRGVRTRGTAGGGRREYYGAHDVRAITSLSGTWHGHDLGAVAPVEPPPDFGFSSTPRRPSVTDVTTTIDRPSASSGRQSV